MEFEKVTGYINALNAKSNLLKREQYTSNMDFNEFIPTVDDDAACLLRMLLRLKRPYSILEIGTSVGFSTVSMAMAAKEYGGHITTIEYDDKAADQAQKNFDRAGVSEYITILRGDAREILKTLDGGYDLIFQDVDKRLYPILLDDCIRLLREDGLLLSDDALFPVLELDEKWRDQIDPITRYNELVMASPLLESVLLPVGDGIMVSVKVRQGV